MNQSESLHYVHPLMTENSGERESDGHRKRLYNQVMHLCFFTSVHSLFTRSGGLNAKWISFIHFPTEQKFAHESIYV